MHEGFHNGVTSSDILRDISKMCVVNILTYLRLCLEYFWLTKRLLLKDFLINFFIVVAFFSDTVFKIRIRIRIFDVRGNLPFRRRGLKCPKSKYLLILLSFFS